MCGMNTMSFFFSFPFLFFFFSTAYTSLFTHVSYIIHRQRRLCHSSADEGRWFTQSLSGIAKQLNLRHFNPTIRHIKSPSRVNGTGLAQKTLWLNTSSTTPASRHSTVII